MANENGSCRMIRGFSLNGLIKGSIVSAYSYIKGKLSDFVIISGNPATVVGDTRNIDNEFLSKHPELAAFYREWAGNIGENNK